jgi:hypothetical protein
VLTPPRNTRTRVTAEGIALAAEVEATRVETVADRQVTV